MGTNYYHRTNLCNCCGRYDERHICKSMRMFRGYKPDQWDEPGVPELLTWQQWKAHLLTGGTVWDEYGVQEPLAHFIAGVEAQPMLQRQRQTTWVLEHGYSPEHDWHDPDGYSFHDGDFS